MGARIPDDIQRQLTELEQQVVADARSGWNEPLAERLRAEIYDLRNSGSDQAI